jgi:hypothetical protein
MLANFFGVLPILTSPLCVHNFCTPISICAVRMAVANHINNQDQINNHYTTDQIVLVA